jgi:hypothetical protein
MTAPKDGLIRRSMRRFTLGSGPLKRRSDRAQVIGRLVVVLSFLVAPPLAVAAATATTVHLQAVAAAEAAERSRTRAVLLEDATARRRMATDYSGGSPSMAVPVQAVWPVPGGTSREGTVRVRPGLPVGTAVPVWVDREGYLTRPPLDRSGIPTRAATMGALPLFGVPLATWTLYAILRFALDTHRERRWAEDWAAVEPDWNSRLL